MRKNAEIVVLESGTALSNPWLKYRRWVSFIQMHRGIPFMLIPLVPEYPGMTYNEAMGERMVQCRTHENDKERLRKGWEAATQKKEISVSEYYRFCASQRQHRLGNR